MEWCANSGDLQDLVQKAALTRTGKQNHPCPRFSTKSRLSPPIPLSGTGGESLRATH